MVVKNLMAALITIAKGIKVTQVVVANVIPPVEVTPGMLEKLDQIQGIQQSKMTVEQRKKLLFQHLDLSALDRWLEGNQVAAWALLAEYHDIFSLKSGKLCCMDVGKHEIRVVDEPFKERFQRIPPPMVDEVRAHMKELWALSALVKAHGVMQLC